MIYETLDSRITEEALGEFSERAEAEGYAVTQPDLVPLQHLCWADGLVNMNFFRRVYGREYKRLEAEIGERAANFLMVESQGIYWRQSETTT